MGGRSDDQRAKGDKDPRPEPNLELPSFRLRRKKKPAEPSLVTPEPSVVTREPSVVTPEPSVVTPEPSLVGEEARRRVVPPPPPIRTAPAPPAAIKHAAAPPPPRPRPPAPPAPPLVKLPAVEPSTTVDAPEPAKLAKPPKAAKPPKEPKAAKPPKEPKPKRVKEPKPPRQRSAEPPAWLPGYVAAIVIGALSGGLTVLLAWATSEGCAAVRGVGTCGGYGVFALVAILAIDVIVATSLLRLCRVIDPATTAMLGVGLVAVLAMLFFLGETQSFAMVYVIPTLMAATFAFSWWITKAIAQRVDD